MPSITFDSITYQAGCNHMQIQGKVNTKPFTLTLHRNDFQLDKDNFDEAIVVLLRHIKATNNYTFPQLKNAVEGTTIQL